MTNSMQTSNNIMLGIFVIAMGLASSILLMSVFERSQGWGIVSGRDAETESVYAHRGINVTRRLR